jgi:DNA-binding transcriptional MerR regulator
MTILLTIGDFSRMTHLSVKALRHYHDVGLLEPAEVDGASGYRLYEASQVPIAQVIRRFRDLGMPVDEVKSVLAAPDVTTRNQVIVAHLERMEQQLQETQATVASLRAVLDAPRAPAPVEYRSVGPTPALAIVERAYELPAIELAIMLHEGSYDDLDRTYGALGTHVAARAIGVEGPVRELYVVSPFHVQDPADLRTELGWPVFRAG